MIKEIKDHIQRLKDENIVVNIDNDQVDDFIHKLRKKLPELSLEDSASKTFDMSDLDQEKFIKKYENTPLHTDKSGNRHNINNNTIHNALNDYHKGIIPLDTFKQKYGSLLMNLTIYSCPRKEKKRCNRSCSKKVTKIRG